MSKAVLAINMPECCDKCYLSCSKLNTCWYTQASYFGDENDDFDPSFNKLSNCPLRELPEPDNENYFPDEYQDGYAAGWNACLREIMGEKKDE